MKSIPPDIESLLESERHAAPLPLETQARVQRRLEATLGLAAAAAVTASSAATQAATQAVGNATGATAAIAGKAVALKLVIGLLGTALLGGGAYVALQHKSAPPVAAAPLLEEQAPRPRVPQRMVIPHTAPAPRVVHVRPQKGIADEQAFLEEARAALLGGSPERALRLLSQHERDFPAAQMGEARDSLVIQALLAQGRVDLARAKAAEFRRRHPRSLFQPAVDAAISR